MCGIVGGKYNKNIIIEDIIKNIKHRGPDSDGFFYNNNVFLGHTRLSILDLSNNGNQPMFSDDRNFVIIFNGEIYNHKDLRNSLSEFDFKSNSDTETILFLYIKYGTEFLSLLNGIFSIAIYDIKKNIILLARDQMGVKPLYYYSDESSFLFSSEMKVFNLFDTNMTIDLIAISDYISFLWSPNDKTPYNEVKKVPPGTFLIIPISDHQNYEKIKYYDIPFNGSYFNFSEEKLINELEIHLINAVKRQMLSDVPIGFFLSGGLDSSLLVAIAKKIKPEIKFECFTIQTDNLLMIEGFEDDLYYAQIVADYLNVNLNIVKSDLKIIENFDKMIWHLDEPQSDAAPLNVLLIANNAKEKGIKVLIGGVAGDDLFSGYRRHRAIGFEKILKFIPRFVLITLKFFVNFFKVNKPYIRRLKKLTQDLDKKNIDRILGYFLWISNFNKHNLFSKNSLTQLKSHNSIDELKSLLKNIPNEKNLLNQILYIEQKTFLVNHNLNYTDKMSMAVGVEARVPYLDLELVNFAAKIPPEYKYRNGVLKYLLKKVSERYLPTEVIYRPKTGFGVPIRKWVTEDLDIFISKRLSKSKIRERGIFDPDSIWKLIEDNKKGKLDASYTIFSLLAIESWFMQFQDKNTVI